MATQAPAARGEDREEALPVDDHGADVRRARVGESGRFELVEVQPAGGRPRSYEDYVRGHGEIEVAGTAT